MGCLMNQNPLKTMHNPKWMLKQLQHRHHHHHHRRHRMRCSAFRQRRRKRMTMKSSQTLYFQLITVWISSFCSPPPPGRCVHCFSTDRIISIRLPPPKPTEDSWCCLVISRSEDDLSAAKFSRNLCQLIQDSEMSRRKRKHPTLNTSTFSWRYIHHRDVIVDDLVIPYDTCFPAFVSASLEAISQKPSIFDAITSCAREMDIRKMQVGILSRLRRLEDLKA
jgi:hypothetical protein